MRILLINPNSNRDFTAAMDRSVSPLRASGACRIDCVSLEGTPLGIETQRDIDSVIDPLCRLVEQESDRTDAFVIGCFADTGLFGIHAATGAEDIDELMPVLTGELERASLDISEAEVARAKAQMRASLLMSLESPAARAGQLARQVLLFGRTIPVDELVAKIDAVDTVRLRELAGRIFTGSTPTLAAIGPIERLAHRDRIAERLGSPVAA